MRRSRGRYRRRRRGRKIWTALGVILAALLVILVLLLTVSVTDITVTGNKQYTEEQVIDLIFNKKWSRNSAYCYYENRFREPKTIPFIERYQVSFKSPTKVEIVVFEKSVTGYVSYMSSYMYFDKDGIIVESSSTQLPGVPWITGLDFGHIVLYQPLTVENSEIFSEVLNLTQVLSVNEVRVDKIHFNKFNESEIYIGDITVEMGSNDNISGKVAELADILPELSGLSGTLYLDTYDETNSNPTYTFKTR